MAQRMICSCANSQLVLNVNVAVFDMQHTVKGSLIAQKQRPSTTHKPELGIAACSICAQQSFSLTIDFEIKRWVLPVLHQSPRLTRERKQSQADVFLRGGRQPAAHIRWITFERAILDVVYGRTPGTILEAAEKTVRR